MIVLCGFLGSQQLKYINHLYVKQKLKEKYFNTGNTKYESSKRHKCRMRSENLVVYNKENSVHFQQRGMKNRLVPWKTLSFVSSLSLMFTIAARGKKINP